MLVVLLPLAAVAIAGCGDEAGDAADESAETPATAVSTKGLPKPLAENRKQANQIIDGSTEALDAKLAELQGHPVVVNQWGSWCPPCRAEFPFFSEVAEEHAADVAFAALTFRTTGTPPRSSCRSSPFPTRASTTGTPTRCSLSTGQVSRQPPGS